MPDDKGNVSEQEKAELAKRRGQAANTISDPKDKQKFIAAQGDAEADNKGKLSLTKYNDMNLESALKGYKHGTDKVPNTGPAVLHKGEAVLKKDDADKYRAAKKNVFGDLATELGGDDKPKSKKELDHIKTRKAKSGGYIHEHHFTNPADHQMEMHVSPDQGGMLSHMMEHMGDGAGAPEADAAPAA